MSRIFTEENGLYQIDCSKAAWATDELNYQYHAANCMLSDVDWVVETNKRLYLVEYKNANIPDAVNPGAFSPQSDKMIDKVVRKFYDSLHYLSMLDNNKPKEYVYILEYPHGDSVSRKMIRNRLKAKLPFALQENIGKQKLIEKVEVLSIAEWNADPQYGEFPIQPV